MALAPNQINFNTPASVYTEGALKVLEKPRTYLKIAALAISILKFLEPIYEACASFLKTIISALPFLQFAAGFVFLINLVISFFKAIFPPEKEDKAVVANPVPNNANVVGNPLDPKKDLKNSTEAKVLRISKKTIDNTATTISSLAQIGCNPLASLGAMTPYPILDLVANPAGIITNGIGIYRTIDKLCHMDSYAPEIQTQRKMLLGMRLADKIFKIFKTCIAFAAIFCMAPMSFIILNPYFILVMIAIECIYMFAYSITKNALNDQIDKIQKRQPMNPVNPALPNAPIDPFLGQGAN